LLKYLSVYLTFLITLIAVDLVWLLGIAKTLYRDQMGGLMASEPKLLIGLFFYLLYSLGICIFVIAPAISKQSLLYAVQYGALFGFFCYMTYDLTNLAVIQNFPTRLALIDIVWGTFVSALCAGIAYWMGERLS
jgi:uncharacterized membrane protein